MKLRSFFSVLSGVVLTLLLIGAAGAYWLASARPSVPVSQPRTIALQPAATLFVSRQAPLMASLLVNPDRLDLLGKSAGKPGVSSSDRTALQTQLQQWQQSLFAETELDYERDLQPWVGDEVTFAITTPDLDRDPQNGLQAGHLLVLSMQNPSLARESVQRFWQRRTKNLATDSFAGVTLTYAANQANPQLTSAIVGDRYVLFANSPKVMRDALNTAQLPESSLDRSSNYQQALEKFAVPKLGLVFANLNQFERWQPESSLLSVVAPAATTGTYESLVAVLNPEGKGLLTDVVLFLKDPGSQPIQAGDPTNLKEILKFVPDRSSLALVNADLQQSWQQWQSNLAGQAENQDWTNGWPQQIANLQQQWGMNFSDTGLDWAKGPFVLAQVARSNAGQPDWLFVTQRSPELEAGIAQLNQITQQQGISLGSFALGEQTVYAWTKLVTGQVNPSTGTSSLEAKVQGVHTAIGEYEIFATSLEAMEQSLAALKGTQAASEVQTAATQLQTPNAGYLYLSQTPLTKALRTLVGSEVLAKSTASSLRSALVSSYGLDESGLRSGVFLNLKD